MFYVLKPHVNKLNMYNFQYYNILNGTGNKNYFRNIVSLKFSYEFSCSEGM